MVKYQLPHDDWGKIPIHWVEFAIQVSSAQADAAKM